MQFRGESRPTLSCSHHLFTPLPPAKLDLYPVNTPTPLLPRALATPTVLSFSEFDWSRYPLSLKFLAWPRLIYDAHRLQEERMIWTQAFSVWLSGSKLEMALKDVGRGPVAQPVGAKK